MATDVVVNIAMPSLVVKVNGGMAVSADCQKDEKDASASIKLTVDLGVARTSSRHK